MCLTQFETPMTGLTILATLYPYVIPCPVFKPTKPQNHLNIRLKPQLAERGGFEPPVPFGYSRFPGVRVKPLCHLSTRGVRPFDASGRIQVIAGLGSRTCPADS